ncbi:hypothetical protein niasHT_038325 [Heterodera trifolii]|uniref:Integrase catalytic domain-containing protein n=1 Tax=Heterodera trifolii TaxID=157864 RepID=A0ABD2J1Z8_9BILA
MLTSPQFHAGMAERANRSIKERLYRYFTERGTYKWIEVVQDIVKGINYSINSSIGMRPADVNFGNAEELRQKLYNEAKKIPKMSPKFKVGDRVTRQIHSGFDYHENYNSTPNGKLDSLLLYILILGLRLVLLNNNLSKLNGKQEIRCVLKYHHRMSQIQLTWGLESGNRVLTNVLEGKDLKESLVSEGIGQTFVQQLKVTVGNTEVYDSGNLYPFKAYITNELSFPVNAKKNFLGSTGYYHTERHNDETDDGFKERCKVFKANDDTKYRLTVHDVKIYAKMIEVQPSLNMNLYKTLEKQPATYAVRKTEIKSSYISSGRYEFEYNVFSSTIPRRVNNSVVHAGGMVYPVVPHKLNFSKNYYVRAFVEMYEALGMANSERSFDVSMDQFKNGWAFFVIPLNSTLDDSCGFELLRSGTTSIRATFDSPIPKGGVEMIVLGEFDQMIMIDYNRHIVSDSKLGKKEKCHQVKTLTVPFNHPAMFSLFNSRINNLMQTPSCKLKLKMPEEGFTLELCGIRFLFGNKRAPAIEADRASSTRTEHEAEIFRQYAENQTIMRRDQ